jgi:hypothetical protein
MHMKIIAIETDINQKIIHPGDTVIRRNEKVAWTCEDFDFEIVFDPNLNPGQNPEHPFNLNPPNPPPGHVTGPAGDFQQRHVRPRAAAGTIPNGARYKYNIIIKNPGSPAVVDKLDPVIIVNGDK